MTNNNAAYQAQNIAQLAQELAREISQASGVLTYNALDNRGKPIGESLAAARSSIDSMVPIGKYESNAGAQRATIKVSATRTLHAVLKSGVEKSPGDLVWAADLAP